MKITMNLNSLLGESVGDEMSDVAFLQENSNSEFIIKYFEHFMEGFNLYLLIEYCPVNAHKSFKIV
jgi:hypothetical protein